MATRKRKVRGQRASRTHGWGTSGQHRGSGMLGGHGNVGRLRHTKSYVIRFGIKDGRKRLLPKLVKQRRAITCVGQLEDILSDPSCAHSVTELEGKKLLDLRSLGYAKLLGSGSIRIPILVRIDRCSKTAASKIEAVGGQVQSTPS